MGAFLQTFLAHLPGESGQFVAQAGFEPVNKFLDNSLTELDEERRRCRTESRCQRDRDLDNYRERGDYDVVLD
ncbi:hypothetical protein [Salinispora arenicola]|uniref:hypothetical protein n=1 Tax=Salinispora arenicola TaxID=168697 RepID=UPI001E355C1D|nr:hypothetical protein [Salinispora arenicola]